MVNYGARCAVNETAAGMNADKKIGLQIISCGCSIVQAHLVIIGAAQYHPIIRLQFGCQNASQVQGYRFFQSAFRSSGADFIAAVAGIQNDELFKGFEQLLFGCGCAADEDKCRSQNQHGTLIML